MHHCSDDIFFFSFYLFIFFTLNLLHCHVDTKLWKYQHQSCCQSQSGMKTTVCFLTKPGLVKWLTFPPACADQQQNCRTVVQLWKDSASGFNERPTQTADALLCQLLAGLPNSWLGRCKNRLTHSQRLQRCECILLIKMTSAYSVIWMLWFCIWGSGWWQKGNTVLLVALSAQISAASKANCQG